ncbi:hypothetical protein VMCG_04045 [Cytospora schulzeri]|uniref:Uncharacterized protein n=1 Tax=Cytospora schulzeri TaxID=448051 RepID=A0A423WUR7_9PEZI|nr:hypothetical protein VMCG_04045 [Valsa malicola]
MGLAMKIKEKITPDTSKSGEVGETNMHPKNNTRRPSPNTSDDGLATHNGVDKTEPFRGHRQRDSGIDVGHDSRFIEHVEVDPPKKAPRNTSGTHPKDPVSNHLPVQSRGPTARVPDVSAVGGGKYSDEPAGGPSIRKVTAEGAGAAASSRAGIKPDYLTLEDPGNNTAYDRNYSRPSLQNTRAYKSDAPLGIPRSSIVDGYDKEQSAEGKLKEGSSSPPGTGIIGRGYEAQRAEPKNLGVTPDTSVNYLRDYTPGSKAGGHPPNPRDGHGARRGSSVERATVPYAGELDKLEDTDGGVHESVWNGNDSAHSTLSGVRDSGLGRGGIHNGVTGHGAAEY